MKKPIYVLLVLTLTIFSCQKAELNEDIAMELDIVNIDANDSQSRTSKSDSKVFEELCFKSPLKNQHSLQMGWVYFTVFETGVKINFAVNKEWSLKTTNLSIADCNAGDNSLIDLGNPDVNQFEYSTFHKGKGVSEYAYSIDKSNIDPYSCFAAQASVIGLNGKQEVVWAGDWASYSVADLTDCGTWWPGAGDEVHVFTNDVEFFIPLTASSSGKYPNTGTSADVVSLTPESPVSEGTLNIDLVFDGIPENFTDATLSISFFDLDLSMDTVSSNGNVASFYETFTLLTEDNEILAVLDETDSRDGEFTWTFDIPQVVIDNLQGGTKLTLRTRMNANLELLEGDGLQVTNTSENMFGISIVGLVNANEEIQ